jgi:protein-disulfide isomerase
MSPVESDEEDLTRKQRREQARAERKALEQAELAGAARRARLMQLGIVVAVVVVAIVVVLVATGGKGHKAATPQGENAVSTKVGKLLAGIPQNANALGKPTAPVTIQYFGDLECPFCKEFSTNSLPLVIEKWVRSGKARIEYRALETATREQETFRTQQIAALAAGKQGKLWDYVETFYNEQGEEDSGYVTEQFLQKIAQEVPGLNLAKWTSDRGESTFANEVVADGQAANAAGFNGTPSFLIGKTGGELKKLEVTSFTDPGQFNEAIEKLLAS